MTRALILFLPFYPGYAVKPYDAKKHTVEKICEMMEISKPTLYIVFGFFILVSIIFLGQAWKMQIIHGSEYVTRSQNNILRPIPVFAGRGVIFDRNGVELAWNAPGTATSTVNGSSTPQGSLSDILRSSDQENGLAHREYATSSGLAHVLGYVQYPSKDTNGFYYQSDFTGVDGVEKYFNDQLQGVNGSRLVEVDARGHVVSQDVVQPPQQGENITLSIDSALQSDLFQNIQNIAEQSHFNAGAGVIMDVHSGEILALTSYPEFDPEIMSSKTDVSAVKQFLNDSRLDFLDRAVGGLYTPGSIMKPYVALGVLNEHVIDPLKIIVTTGSISIPNPYDPTKSTLFRDWKNLGALDLRHALEWSSDVYFYTVGGGYGDQKGLGIANIDKYVGMFGFGSSTTGFFSGKSGTIPSPAWKQATFGEPWYLGDTYHT